MVAGGDAGGDVGGVVGGCAGDAEEFGDEGRGGPRTADAPRQGSGGDRGGPLEVVACVVEQQLIRDDDLRVVEKIAFVVDSDEQERGDCEDGVGAVEAVTEAGQRYGLPDPDLGVLKGLNDGVVIKPHVLNDCECRHDQVLVPSALPCVRPAESS